MKIAVLLPNWVGDVAMATPALRALRGQYPSAHIVALVRPYLTSLLGGTDWIDEIWPCEHRKWRGSIGWRANLASLRRMRPDILVSLRGSFRSTMMALLARSRLSVGVDRAFSSLLNRRYRTGQQVQSEVDRYLGCAAMLGCETTNQQLELRTTFDDERTTVRAWNRLGISVNSPVVMINGGAATATAKQWPADRFADLARRIVDETGAQVLVNCGPGERELARGIAEMAGRSGVVTLADEPELSFGLLKGLLRRVDLLVSTDSGPRHVAAAMGTPVIAVFGSTDPRRSHNYNPQETAVRLELSCSPCHRYRCPLGHLKCMNELPVQRVFQAVIGRLTSRQRCAA